MGPSIMKHLPIKLVKYAKRSRKADDLDLAQIIYDIFKENQANGNISNGQNNANQTKEK